MKAIWHPNTLKLYEVILVESHHSIYLVLELAAEG